MISSLAIQYLVYFAVLAALAVPLGLYVARVYTGEARLAGRVFGPVERLFYRLAGVRPDEEMSWKKYAVGLLALNLFGILFVYAILRLQARLPFNPAALGPVSPRVAFNTAVSFGTNTNWQTYSGETALSHLSQMVALTVQNFLSAATGMAVAAALARGFARNAAAGIGNCWVDVTRGTLHVLLPLSALFAVLLVSQGTVQTWAGKRTVGLLSPHVAADGRRLSEQVLATGPVASQVAIKQLGTNGGGYYNANSSHPFENPTAISNFAQLLAILLLPAAFCFTFGAMVRSRRQGWMLFAVVLLVLLPLLAVCACAEKAGNPVLARLGVSQDAGPLSPGGNMEGKEVRFGVGPSALWATVTAASSNGSVNSMHDSMTPLGGLVPLWLMQLGEVVFGGVGSGLYGLIAFAVVAVFLAGLMVGRTPEFLGKKLAAFEMKMASLAILIPASAVLLGTAVACVVPSGRASVGNPGAHGFSEILYAFSSCANNNGSAFAGLDTSTPFYTTALGLAMLVGRYWVIVPMLAMAGALARKKAVPVTAGTLPTATPLFALLLAGTILLVGALAFLPALALGPIAEHFGPKP